MEKKVISLRDGNDGSMRGKQRKANRNSLNGKSNAMFFY